MPRAFPLISLRSDARQPPILNAEVVPPSRRPFYEAEVEVVNHNILRKNGDLGSLVEVEIIKDPYDHKRLPAASVVVRKEPRDWGLRVHQCGDDPLLRQEIHISRRRRLPIGTR